jgi:hypothetical protein
MVALSASRLVCAAMVLIRPTTSPIRPADLASPCTVPSVSRGLADRAARSAGRMCRPLADVVIEALSCSEAVATLSTLVEASPEAFSATWTRALVWRETVDRPVEVVRILPEAI